jgi:hypothetical protein
MNDHDTLVDSWADEFRHAYNEDVRNAKGQPFDDYWRWVKAFLVTGGSGQRGWLDQGDEVLQRVRDADASRELQARVQGIGRQIAAEWAKQSRCRRVHSTLLQGSPNLYDWGKRLERAAGKDPGDGAVIADALDAIERELQKALRA